MATNYDDIRCYVDSDVPAKLWPLADNPALEAFVRGAFPELDMDALRQQLKQTTTIRDFQRNVVARLVLALASKTTTALELVGTELIDPQQPSVYITNHRDIVLDSAFLNTLLATHNLETAEIAIGDNLLAYDWIRDLVRLNKSFIVLRSVTGRELMAASLRMSQYIRYATTEKHDSIWIAQREGRSKDCSDRTQAAVIKMLALGGSSRDLLTNIRALNLQPVAISYEYDPCDYLKARELQLKRDDPEWHKTKEDDLTSMATGLRGQKGRVVLTVTPPLNAEFDKFPTTLTASNAQATAVCTAVDNALHAAMRLFPINYVAYDLLNDSNKYANMYTDGERSAAITYLNSRLSLIELPHRDEAFLWHQLLTQYANPVVNKEALTERPTTNFIPLT